MEVAKKNHRLFHFCSLLARLKAKNAMTSAPSSGVDLVDLRFAYGGSASNGPLLLDGFTLSLPPGARCLLVGANGAGGFFSLCFFFFFPVALSLRQTRGPLTATSSSPSPPPQKKT